MHGIIAFGIYKLKAMMSQAKSVLATLDYTEFFMVSSFSKSITLVISPLAPTLADDDNQTKTTVQLSDEACILL